MKFPTSIITFLALVLTACGGGSGQKTGNDPRISLPREPLTLFQNLAKLDLGNSTILELDIAFGSGAFHLASDPVNVFYTITDRGPIVPCKDSKKVFGKKNLCKNNGITDNDGKIFLLRDYAPRINKIRLNHHKSSGRTDAEVLQTILLRDNNGHPIKGIANPLKSAKTEKLFTTKGKRIPFDPSGLDTEALIRLSNGSFWLSDEYAPSLVHVALDGKIINRVVPQGIDDDLENARYPVSAGLQKILRSRPVNRGIEALAVSPDETTLFFMLQSPLANPDRNTFKKSRVIRLFSYALNSDGSLGNAIGEYVYSLDKPEDFTADSQNLPNQNNIFVTDMSALNSRELLVLERTNARTKIYKIGLSMASNILASKFDKKSTSPSLEQIVDLDSLAIIPISKSLVFDSSTPRINPLSGKIEGMAVLDKTHILLINDNDFGVTGDSTLVNIIEIPKNTL